MKEINNLKTVVGGSVKANAALAVATCGNGNVSSVDTNGFSCK